MKTNRQKYNNSQRNEQKKREKTKSTTKTENERNIIIHLHLNWIPILN